ncbi:MAG: T9SS type A sorting domain-containing protein, partial [Bacteroidales bacterium]|nr:T9SS type A sorting domain-containing protein [Bacteroidales bacterium]
TVNDISYNSFHFTVNADNMRMNSYDVDSSVSGSITITINNRNFGHATLQHGTVSLLPLDQLLSVTSPQSQEFDIANIQAGGESTVSFTLALNGERPESRLIPLIQVINNTFRSNQDTIWLLFGRDNRVITFEDNSWSSYPWYQDTIPWQNVVSGAYEGSRCLRSGNCGHGNKSELSITWTSTIDDSITFYKNVSSEDSYDWFKFYIDGQQMERLSGTGNQWSRSAFFVPRGTHTFKFSYEKDGSVSNGSDCAWIDNLHLPLSGTNYIYLLDSICQGSEYQFRDSLISTEGFDAGIHHFVDSAESTVYSLTLVLTPTPQITITGGDVTIRKGETVRLTATGAESYIWSSGETSSIIDVYPTETTTYTVTGYNGACSSKDSTTITVEGMIGIREQLSTTNIKLYPNPAQSTLTIDGEGVSRIAVIDITGRTIAEKNVEGTRNNIDVSSLNDGVYFLQVFDGKGNKTTHKFVKKK